MAETQLLDYQLAKRKALVQLGLPSASMLPSHLDVELELKRWLEVFPEADYAAFVAETRRELSNALDFFAAYQPAVVGSLVRGAFILGDVVRLHLFADFAEEVMMLADGAGIPYELHEVALALSAGGRSELFSQLRLQAGNAEIWATIFPLDAQRSAPISTVTKRPSKRYSGQALRDRLDELYGAE